MIEVNALSTSGTLDITATRETIGGVTHVAIVVANRGTAAVEAWSADLVLPAAVVGIYGATICALGSIRYRLTPDRWRQRIAAGRSVSIGVLVSGGPPQKTTACPSFRGSEPATYTSPQRITACPPPKPKATPGASSWSSCPRPASASSVAAGR